MTGLFLYHFHLTHRRRTPAVLCSELTKRFALSLTTLEDLPKHPWGCRQDSRQVSKEGQKDRQPVPSDWLQGGHYHQSKCCPPWDGCWEGCWDSKRSSPRWLVPVPHTEEDTDPGYWCIGLTERLLDTQFIQWMGIGICSQILCDVQVVLSMSGATRDQPHSKPGLQQGDSATGSKCSRGAPLHCAPHALARARVNCR